jgi:hypothetical protein
MPRTKEDSPKAPAPVKVMVTKDARVSTISGILIFKKGKTFTDPALIGIMKRFKIKYVVIPEEVPEDDAPVDAAPDTHA